VPGVGPVLVNSQGHTLYVFQPDNATKVTCVGSCALVWPPLKLSAGTKPTASGEVNASKLSSYPDPEGGQVVTYAGWPLYTYVVDSGAGTAKGQAILANGGYWYVISPSGKVIH
jgi:predicted lipoprotein with Yx(FWY)xxD motif